MNYKTLGIDIGSTTVKIAILDENENLIFADYKRRTYAQTQSYLTPPFKESELRQTYKQLSDAIQSYEKKASAEQSLKVKALTVKMGIARELGLDAKQMNKPYSADVQNGSA